MAISPGSGQIALQVVESKESETELDLEGTEAGTGGLCLSRTDPDPSGGDESGAGVKASPSARVSMTEEPGAGKLHAGICAGGTG